MGSCPQASISALTLPVSAAWCHSDQNPGTEQLATTESQVSSSKSESQRGPISGPLSCEPSLLWSPLCGKGLLFIPTRESPPLGGASKQLQSQRGPCSLRGVLAAPDPPPHHPVPRGPNEARPQVLPPQCFTFYYALLESVSHCLGRAARAYPPRS